MEDVDLLDQRARVLGVEVDGQRIDHDGAIGIRIESVASDRCALLTMPEPIPAQEATEAVEPHPTVSISADVSMHAERKVLFEAGLAVVHSIASARVRACIEGERTIAYGAYIRRH